MNDSRSPIDGLVEAFHDASGRDAIEDACRNLEGALRTTLDAGAVRPAARLFIRCVAPLAERDRIGFATRWLDALIDAAQTAHDSVTEGRVREARAGLLRTPRRYSEALDDQNAAIALLDGQVTEAEMITLRHDHAVLLADLGSADDAVTGLVAAREAFLGLRDRVGVAAADHNLGFVLHDLGMVDDAIEYLTEARDIFLAIDMPEEAASCDQNLGVVFYDAGRLTEAGRRFAVAHRRFAEHGAWHSAAECDANLATLLTTMGQTAEAATYRARAEAAGVGMPTSPGTSAQLTAIVDDAGPHAGRSFGTAFA